MGGEEDFWKFLSRLVANHAVIMDRPKGSAHPRYPDLIYPIDYGYLEDTSTVDGGGIDIWLGASKEKRVTGVICTVDLKKNDAELKIVLGCSDGEVSTILDFLNDNSMRAIYIKREDEHD